MKTTKDFSLLIRHLPGGRTKLETVLGWVIYDEHGERENSHFLAGEISLDNFPTKLYFLGSPSSKSIKNDSSSILREKIEDLDDKLQELKLDNLFEVVKSALTENAPLEGTYDLTLNFKPNKDTKKSKNNDDDDGSLELALLFSIL